MLKRIPCLLLVALTLVSCFVLPSSAATCSSGKNTRTITVSTYANYWIPGSSSITLKQTKGTIAYSKTNIWGQHVETRTTKEYGCWDVSVRATDGSHSYTKQFNGSSVKLTLKPNKTYKITVSYDSTQEIFLMIKRPNSRWNTYPSWRVSSSWKVSSYY